MRQDTDLSAVFGGDGKPRSAVNLEPPTVEAEFQFRCAVEDFLREDNPSKMLELIERVESDEGGR